MLLVYRSLINIFFPIIILITYLRIFFDKEDQKRFKEKLFSTSFNMSRNFQKKLIWFHVASLGEYKSILPIIKRLNNDKFEFLITSLTLSSAELINLTFRNERNIHHRFFPIDKLSLVKKFLDGWRPDITLFVDSEIWPNFLFELKKRKIPLILLNARITKKTFNRWMLIPFYAKKIFRLFDLCLTSSEETKRYLNNLEAQNVKHFGNIKLAGPIEENEIYNKNETIFNQKKLWCAASTHKGEETFCIKVHNILKKKYDNIITAIIPRHINRSKTIYHLCEKQGLKSQIIKDGELIKNETEIVVVNDYNVLIKYFKFSKSVFIGKSIIKNLKKVGGQNPIEAAKMGCKVYHGPYVNNFKDIYNLFGKYKISEQIENENDLANKISEDFKTSENKLENYKIINKIGDKVLTESVKQIEKFL